MDWLWTIIGALLAGIIIGPLARLVLPGRQNISMGMTILVGAVGASWVVWWPIGSNRDNGGHNGWHRLDQARHSGGRGRRVGHRLRVDGRKGREHHHDSPHHPRNLSGGAFGQTSSRTRSMTSSSMS